MSDWLCDATLEVCFDMCFEAVCRALWTGKRHSSPGCGGSMPFKTDQDDDLAWRWVDFKGFGLRFDANVARQEASPISSLGLLA